jgi:hypothetical protein
VRGSIDKYNESKTIILRQLSTERKKENHMKTGRILLLSGILILMLSGFAIAANTASVSITATVSPSATLEVVPLAIVFPDSDPDSGAITGTVLTITSKVKTGGIHAADLTWKAPDLSNGTDTIAISNVSWTAQGTGTGYVDGTLSNTDVNVGHWTHSGNYVGTLTPKLVNSWDYNVGTYTSASTFTLSSP